MATKRKARYDKETEKPLPITIMFPAHLARFLYRERILRNFGSETELAHNVVRLWTEGLDPMNWSQTLKLIKEEEQRESAEDDKDSEAG